MIAYTPHPIADIFPMISGKEFVDLKADIKANGCHEPVVLYEGRILDGRNRSKACQEVGVEPKFTEYQGDDPVGFVISLNLHRRHLNESQRAMVAANIANLPQGGDRRSDQTANLQFETTRAEAAEKLNVSERSVNTAKKVQREGAQELVDAVQQGEVSVSAAAKIAAYDEEEQKEIVDEIKHGAKPAEVISAHNHRAQGTGENEWYTPDEYLEAARRVLGGIDLDPASSEIANQRVKAKRFFTIDDDGLARDWAGKVWMNPPYSQPHIRLFAEKLVDEFQAGRVSEAIALTHNYTDTAWFHIMAQACTAICFTRGRIGFLSPEGKKAAPTQGQAFFYFGTHPDRFADAFAGVGFVAMLVEKSAVEVAA